MGAMKQKNIQLDFAKDTGKMESNEIKLDCISSERCSSEEI